MKEPCHYWIIHKENISDFTCSLHTADAVADPKGDPHYRINFAKKAIAKIHSMVAIHQIHKTSNFTNNRMLSLNIVKALSINKSEEARYFSKLLGPCCMDFSDLYWRAMMISNDGAWYIMKKYSKCSTVHPSSLREALVVISPSRSHSKWHVHQLTYS